MTYHRRSGDSPLRGLCLFTVLFFIMGVSLRPASANPVAAPAPASDLATTYVLSPDDQLDIAVAGHDNLKASVTILPDGTFNYPYVGKVYAAHHTVDELTQLLTQKLNHEVNQPNVTVTVRETRPRKISILGAVKAPGLYDWKPGWHLLQALAACGGPAQAPELTQLTLVTAESTKSVSIDIVALMAGADAAQNPALIPGDVLLVQQRDPSIAQVQVSGEVARPGSYTVPTEGASVVAVLTEAGGPTAQAALTHAQIMHKGQVKDVNLRPMMFHAGDPTGAVNLMAGDVLLIPANTAQIAVMGQVRAPSVYRIPDGDGLPLITALAQAGGATSEGDQKNVYIVRSGADGKRVATAINVEDMLKGGTNAYQLQAGDILFVPDRKHGHNPLEILGLLTPIGILENMLRIH